MTELVPIALYGWIAVVVALFSVIPARRAVIASFVGAWLFLPQAQIDLPGLPDITKISVTSFGVLLGVMAFDARRIFAFRLRWVDLPVIAWCLSPLAASVSNHIGVGGGWYDGLSGVLGQISVWGVPYFVGRLYFSDLEGMRELALGIMIGGLIYLPFCWYEMRMSPRLHLDVYGFHQHSFAQTMRWGGYRPMVFMQHGLMVGLWMAAAALIAVWFWASGVMRRFRSVPIWVIGGLLGLTCVACKSTGAILLLMVGITVIASIRFSPTVVVVLALMLAPPAYLVLRIESGWSGAELVELAAHIDAERAESLGGRMENESALITKAMQRPLFGWGGWGRWRVLDEAGLDATTADSLWVITLGQMGLVGLCSLMATILLPVGLLLRRVPIRLWLSPGGGPPAVIAMLLLMYMMDGMVNAMLNPVFILGAGGISGLYLILTRNRGAAGNGRRYSGSMPRRVTVARRTEIRGQEVSR